MAGLTEIKANSASQQSWSWGLAELGNMKNTETSISIRKSQFINNRADIQTNRNTTIAEMFNASFIDC